MKINSTLDINNQYLNILVYGQPGSGKTTFAGTAQLKLKTLILSAESGLLSLRNIKDKDGKSIKFDYVQVSSFSDIEETYKHLQMEKHDYKAVVMDSGTEIQQVCMEHILQQEKRAKAVQADWGTLNNKMTRMIRSYRDLPMHYIMTALEESETDQATGEMQVRPSFQGKISKTIAAYFDECFYAFAKQEGEKVSYGILTKNSGKYMGKDRSGMLPTAIYQPTFGTVYDMIFKQPEQPKETKEDKK